MHSYSIHYFINTEQFKDYWYYLININKMSNNNNNNNNNNDNKDDIPNKRPSLKTCWFFTFNNPGKHVYLFLFQYSCYKYV